MMWIHCNWMVSLLIMGNGPSELSRQIYHSIIYTSPVHPHNQTMTLKATYWHHWDQTGGTRKSLENHLILAWLPGSWMTFQLTLRVAAWEVQGIGFISHIKVADTLVDCLFYIVCKCCRNCIEGLNHYTYKCLSSNKLLSGGRIVSYLDAKPFLVRSWDLLLSAGDLQLNNTNFIIAYYI